MDKTVVIKLHISQQLKCMAEMARFGMLIIQLKKDITTGHHSKSSWSYILTRELNYSEDCGELFFTAEIVNTIMKETNKTAQYVYEDWNMAHPGNIKQ